MYVMLINVRIPNFGPFIFIWNICAELLPDENKIKAQGEV